jgi:hypothetical protein
MAPRSRGSPFLDHQLAGTSRRSRTLRVRRVSTSGSCAAAPAVTAWGTRPRRADGCQQVAARRLRRARRHRTGAPGCARPTSKVWIACSTARKGHNGQELLLVSEPQIGTGPIDRAPEPAGVELRRLRRAIASGWDIACCAACRRAPGRAPGENGATRAGGRLGLRPAPWVHAGTPGSGAPFIAAQINRAGRFGLFAHATSTWAHRRAEPRPEDRHRRPLGFDKRPTTRPTWSATSSTSGNRTATCTS